jgi:hypothetical protein
MKEQIMEFRGSKNGAYFIFPFLLHALLFLQHSSFLEMA